MKSVTKQQQQDDKKYTWTRDSDSFSKKLDDTLFIQIDLFSPKFKCGLNANINYTANIALILSNLWCCTWVVIHTCMENNI